MRIVDLFEGRDALLYHAMHDDKARNVLITNQMPAFWEHDIPGYGSVTGNSFTRNKNFALHLKRPVVLEINQRALSQRYKIIPLDGDLVFDHTRGVSSPSRDRSRRGTLPTLSEEFVIGDIDDLHKYIHRVILLDIGWLPDPITRELYKYARAYTKKYKVPFTFDPSILTKMKNDIRDRIYDP